MITIFHIHFLHSMGWACHKLTLGRVSELHLVALLWIFEKACRILCEGCHEIVGCKLGLINVILDSLGKL